MDKTILIPHDSYSDATAEAIVNVQHALHTLQELIKAENLANATGDHPKCCFIFNMVAIDAEGKTQIKRQRAVSLADAKIIVFREASEVFDDYDVEPSMLN